MRERNSTIYCALRKKHIYFSKVTRLIWSILDFFPPPADPLLYPPTNRCSTVLAFFFSPPSISCFRGMGGKKSMGKESEWGEMNNRLHFLAAATHANSMPDAKWGGKGKKKDEQHNLAHLSKKEREGKRIQNSNCLKTTLSTTFKNCYVISLTFLLVKLGSNLCFSPLSWLSHKAIVEIKTWKSFLHLPCWLLFTFSFCSRPDLKWGIIPSCVRVSIFRISIFLKEKTVGRPP